MKRIGVIRGSGQKVWVGPDGQLWRRTKGVATALVPVRDATQLAALTGQPVVEEMAPVLESVDNSYIPPIAQIADLRQRLLTAVSGQREAMAIVMRKANGAGHKWLAVVPKQETTAATFEADDLKALFVYWSRRGWEPTGTLHTHPGNWVGASQPDETSWADMPGIHLIVAKKGLELGIFVSVGGHIFKCKKRKLPQLSAKMEIRAVNGGQKWEKNILKTKSVVVHTGIAGFTTPTYVRDGRVLSTPLGTNQEPKEVSDWWELEQEMNRRHERKRLWLRGQAKSDGLQVLAVPYSEIIVEEIDGEMFMVFPITAIKQWSGKEQYNASG